MNDPLGSAAPCCWPLGTPAFTHPSTVSRRQSEPGESLRALSLSRGGPHRIRGGFSVFLFYPVPTPPQTRQIVHPDCPAFHVGDSLTRSLSSQTHRRGAGPAASSLLRSQGVVGPPCPAPHKACLVQASPLPESKPGGLGGLAAVRQNLSGRGGDRQLRDAGRGAGSKQLIRRATWLVAASKLSPSRGHPKAAPANRGPGGGLSPPGPSPHSPQASSFPPSSHPPNFAGFLGFG